MIRPSECQRQNLVGTHTPLQRLRGNLHKGLGVKTQLRAWLSRSSVSEPPRLGAASRFRAGDWVRVASEHQVRATLDARDRLRGLVFVPQQWAYCGGTYRVAHDLRRIVDDRGRFRAVSRTVLLDGVTCEGSSGDGGCGRACPLMFRDEWLEPAASPVESPPITGGHHVHVRAMSEIRATLDQHGQREGLGFMPEMEAWAGKRLRVVRRLDRVYEYDRHTVPPSPIFILEGTQCSGALYGERGPCDRRCAILWHNDWLVHASPDVGVERMRG